MQSTFYHIYHLFLSYSDIPINKPNQENSNTSVTNSHVSVIIKLTKMKGDFTMTVKTYPLKLVEQMNLDVKVMAAKKKVSMQEWMVMAIAEKIERDNRAV